MKQIEEGLREFDVKVEEAVKSISGEGTKIKAMVDKCVAQMIAAVMDQSKIEWDKSTKLLADTKMDLKEGCDLDKKIYELNKTRNDGKLLKSLQKLTDDIAKLTIESLPVFPCIQYTAKPASDKKIQQLFGIIKISAYRPDVKPKEHGKYLYRCSRCRADINKLDPNSPFICVSCNENDLYDPNSESATPNILCPDQDDQILHNQLSATAPSIQPSKTPRQSSQQPTTSVCELSKDTPLTKPKSSSRSKANKSVENRTKTIELEK
ncbi:unnamed protein product [Mytilus edulis]|uniref:Uncharacterized protein n=1 Tax=Mytilus edulis TaxID=6550 RepID=A0A8S3QJX1_MYTED|nr:unnamed protein product [Mytilus edulis]